MNQKVNKVLHKGSSVFALLALIASQIPALLPYQSIFVGLAGVFGGGGLAQDAKDAVEKK